MSVIKFKNPDGTWVEVPTLKGDPGARGEAGIYYGTEAPDSPDHPVWINPDGEGEDITSLSNDVKAVDNKVNRLMPVVFTVSPTWNSGKYTIANEAIKANSVVLVGLGNNPSADAVDAYCGAKMVCESQTDGQSVIKCLGDVPTVAINLQVTVIGG